MESELPSLSRITRALASCNPKWEIIGHNVARGLSNNMYSRRELIKFARAIGGPPFLSQFSGIDRKVDQDIEKVVDAVRKARYLARTVSPDNRIRANPTALPCACAGRPSLSGKRLYRVVDHVSLLTFLLPESNPFWDQEQIVDLGLIPSDTRTSDSLSKLCRALGTLSAEIRRFRLGRDQLLTYGILWFTTEATLPFVWDAPPSEALAKTARDKLGLVHLAPSDRDPRTSHLFCLAFDGEVVDRVGHFRPSAFDGIDNRRFMVPRDLPTTAEAAEWGSTADLSAIDDEKLSLNGAKERVANQILHNDFLNTEALDFMYLGALSAPHLASDRRFADRLAAL